MWWRSLLAGAVALLLATLALAEIPLDQRRSGYDMMSASTKAMQDDDTSNPATLSVLDGEALWSRKAGTDGKACADCHGDAAQSMRGVAARYPAFGPAQGRPIDIEQRINICRTEQQKAPPFAHESRDLLALTAYVAKQSRGMPIEASGIQSNVEAGRAFFHQRQGQLNLACASCHDDNWGKKLGGTPIPQAHPTGYPIYRLEWQGVGSFTRRLRNCLTGMRAELLPHGAPELVDLEAYLMWRARGMKMEAPAVRP